MTYLPAILSTLIAAAGWYYAFYSPAARRLGGVEAPAANRRRVRLRQVNGVAMIVLGGGLYLLLAALENRWRPTTILLLFAIVLFLLLLIGVLAMVDLRLTVRLRQELRDRHADH